MIYQANNVTPIIYGSNKAEFISNTELHTAPIGYVYTRVEALANSVIATLEAGGNYEIIGDPTVTMSAGTKIEGQYKSLSLTSGTVIAYLTKDNIN